jgi:hypothetical protein
MLRSFIGRTRAKTLPLCAACSVFSETEYDDGRCLSSWHSLVLWARDFLYVAATVEAASMRLRLDVKKKNKTNNRHNKREGRRGQYTSFQYVGSLLLLVKYNCALRLDREALSWCQLQRGVLLSTTCTVLRT